MSECVNVGSSDVPKGITLVRNTDNRESDTCVGQRVQRKSLYFPLNFAMNLKLFLTKKALILKTVIIMRIKKRKQEGKTESCRQSNHT